MARPRVLVTGLGTVGPAVRTVEEFWRLVNDPRPHYPVLLPESPGLGRQIGFPAGDVAGASESRLERLVLDACSQAIADSGLQASHCARAGVHVGTTHGAIDLFERDGPEAMASDHAQQLYGAAGLIAATYGCHGPNQTFSTACSSSLNALGLAAEAIWEGRSDVMVVAGGEIFSRAAFGAFERLGGTDSELCRPFDKNREGAVFGEGAAVLVLESEGHFRAREGARAYCAIGGFGWSCDAFHVTAPEPFGGAILEAMTEALQRAGREHQDISCVIPHGTGTRHNDDVEAKALGALLGERRAPVFPLKAFVGHGAGAAGAFNCVLAALIIQNGVVPAIVNCPDPEYDIYLPGTAVEMSFDNILVNAYAFGGNNASVLMESV